MFKEKGPVRNRHLYRKMYQEEFDEIWKKQAEHYPELLTTKLKYGSLGHQQFPTKPIARTMEETEVEQFGIYGLSFSIDH